MQQPSLQLKEIIWEITGECHNGCTYCGSKEIWKNTTDKMTILSIADSIAKYPPKEINISGGDPLCVSFSTHQYITNLLRSQDVTCKILVNPKSLIKNSKEENFFNELAKGKEPNEEAIDKIFLYDWIGISVNTEEELELLEVLQHILSSNYTVISNFNTANLYMFDTIKEFVEKNNLQWQVQLTMTDSKVMAIYKNPKALKTLLNKIQDAYNNNIRVIPADNINNGKCEAGSQSLGILSNGDVIPCLSMRSWNKQLSSLVQENILITSLEEIWETKFKEYRYNCFNCCKDDCGNIDFCLKDSNKYIKIDHIDASFPRSNTSIMTYAVFNSPNYQTGGAATDIS